jgi:hypothetical protein
VSAPAPQYSQEPPPLPAASFYEPLGDGADGGRERFVSTPGTAGPWSPGLQHAGPFSALLGRAFERHDPSPGMRVARVTVEILGPVPVAPVEVAVRTVRPGRRISLLEGELSSGGRTLVRATAWRIAAAPAHLEATAHVPAPPPVPDELVAGEADPPLVRTLTLADSMSGVGSQLDFGTWLIINTDLTVALDRDPDGEWIFMRARINTAPHGSALAEALLADASGAFGRGLQTLLVDARPG